MEDQTRQLVAEFKQITQEYERSLQALPRRAEIVLALVNTGLTHKEVGTLLGVSGGRVSQLVMEAPGYVPQRTPAQPKSTAA